MVEIVIWAEWAQYSLVSHKLDQEYQTAGSK